MERSGDEGGLMELLCPESDEGELFSHLSPSLSSSLSCSSSFFSVSSSPKPNRMLCFGGASSLSTTCSSSPHSTLTTASKASRKSEIAGEGRDRRRTKKVKTEESGRPRTRNVAVRKQKLGEQILALQQLVCPFGKTDTASVLHEARSYIQFLHDQVQVMISPYLQRQPSSARLHEGGGIRGKELAPDDLKSRGLRLVPVSCIEEVANSNSNGADFWSSIVSSSSGIGEETTIDATKQYAT